MTNPQEIETLLREYEIKKSSKLYQAAMDVITRANWVAVKEVKTNMCEALKELMAEEFQEQEELVTKRVTEEVTAQVTEQVTEEFIRTLFKHITDADKLAELLNLPVEQINKVLNRGSFQLFISFLAPFDLLFSSRRPLSKKKTMHSFGSFVGQARL